MANRILLAATVGWASAARYAGGFAAAGCIVEALSPASAPVRASRYVARHYRYRPLFPVASLRAAIAASRADLVVACDDRVVTQLVELHRMEPSSGVGRLIERSLGNPWNYPLMMSRHGALDAMRAEGVRVAESYAIESETALDAALVETGFPAVLKSDGSWGGDGVIVVASRDEARAAFRRLADPPPRWRSLARALRRRDAHYLHDALAPQPRVISLQKFIPGRSAASAFAARDGEVVGTIAYDVLAAQGAIGPPNVIRRVDCPQILEAARRVARRFALSGLHGLDFIRDESGAVHLIEINPRATQGGTLAFGPGRDLPAALAATLPQGNRGMRPAIENDLVAFFPRAWQSGGADPRLAGAHHDIPWDDSAVLVAALGLAPARADTDEMRALVYAKLAAAG
jgi:ATP-grasp domain